MEEEEAVDADVGYRESGSCLSGGPPFSMSCEEEGSDFDIAMYDSWPKLWARVGAYSMM